MKRKRLSTQSRSRLDQRFQELGAVMRYTSPARGWIKAVREALGMTTAQLARRLGIRQPSVVALEQSEAKGTIELATLRRVAEALDCTLVYALVPKKPLEDIVRERARAGAWSRSNIPCCWRIKRWPRRISKCSWTKLCARQIRGCFGIRLFW